MTDPTTTDPVTPEQEALSRRLAVFRHDTPRRPTRLTYAVLLLAVAAGIGRWATQGPAPWSVETATCSGCTWAVDTPLDTSAIATARIADRGALRASPGTALWRREAPGARLELTQGHLEVFVDAEAAWLTVVLPGVDVVDLGCSFVIDVDAEGYGVVGVSSGAVALRGLDTETILPAGTRAATWPDGHTGLAVSAGASTAFIGLVDAFDQGGPWEPLVQQATRGDAITLWHLLDRAPEQPVRDRLETLLGADAVEEGASREELLTLIIQQTL